MTDELKKKISEATKKAMANPELRKRLSEMKKGRVISPEHRAKMIEGIKKSYENRKGWNFGLKCPHSEETKIKIGLGNKGKTRSEETKQKISKIVTANPNMYWKDKKRPEVSQWLHTKEVAKKISDTLRAKITLGERFGGNQIGEKNPSWKGGVSRAYKSGYYSIEYKEWRKAVFERDGYACRICGHNGFITAHHIKSFAHYPELRFELNNGMTLCEECHKSTDNYKGRNRLKVKINKQ